MNNLLYFLLGLMVTICMSNTTNIQSELKTTAISLGGMQYVVIETSSGTLRGCVNLTLDRALLTKTQLEINRLNQRSGTYPY